MQKVDVVNSKYYVPMAADIHYGASKTIFQYAEVLRKNMTIAEKIIWERVCKNQLGVRIRRQHPVWKYIADYYCHELKFIIELDRQIHLLKENREYDIGRDIMLNEFGLEIIRFTNDQVINHIEFVIEAIEEKIRERKSKGINNKERSKSPLQGI